VDNIDFKDIYYKVGLGVFNRVFGVENEHVNAFHQQFCPLFQSIASMQASVTVDFTSSIISHVTIW